MGSCGIINDNKFYIQPNEFCAFKALNTLKTYYGTYYNPDYNFIFNEQIKNDNSNLNKEYRKNQKDNDYIYKYNPNKKDLCNPIDKNEWTVNCAIQMNSPYYTYDNENKKCTLIPNIKNLDPNFSYEKDNTSNYITFKFPEDENNKTIYSYKNRTGFCENKWYDWIITPNYHFGNQYEKDVGNFSKDDIRKCYKPCIKGYLPYFDSKKSEYICIPKDEAEDGLYTNKLDFSPVALINLIGNSEKELYLYNILSIDLLKNKYETDKSYEIDNVKLNKRVYEKDKIRESIKTAINSYLIDEMSMNARNIDKNINVITYKNPLFNENDEELITLRGMDVNGMMIDEILIHTYYLAYYYNNFYELLIKKDSYIVENKNINFDKIIKSSDYNIKNNLSNYLDYDKNKFQRLANILFKAINICYDEKTDFSINLLDNTRLAFKKYKDYFDNKKNTYYKELLKEKDKNKKDLYELIYNYYGKLQAIDIKKLEIPFITSINKEGNSHISNYILDNLKDLTEEKQRNEIKDFYENKNDVIFYTLEDKERYNKCQLGQINNKETGKCEDCKSYCTDEKCKTDKNCGYFCDDICNKNNEKKNNGKCGNLKEEKEKPKEKPKILTPVEDNLNMPDFSSMLKSAIKIVLAILFLYMCYIFYQIYGETLFTLYNYLEYGLVVLFTWIKAYIIVRHDAKENYNFMMKEYIRNNATSKYERVSAKIKAS
jgi:hypothetical protein